uniref:(northern house mosquito) hypothetical protein n=1 Tax=Culex pipiens TaxID=7175 RepID=A0A8D8IMR9_CULPI
MSGRMSGGQLSGVQVTLGTGSFSGPATQTQCRQLPVSCFSTEPTLYETPITTQCFSCFSTVLPALLADVVNDESLAPVTPVVVVVVTVTGPVCLSEPPPLLLLLPLSPSLPPVSPGTAG